MEPNVKPSARRQRSAATRRRVIEAAHAEFLTSGFAGATMAAVAKRAGVAVQTVYFVFHTKAELISAVIDHAVLGDDETAPEDRDWWMSMESAATAHDLLRCFVEGGGPLFERAALISEVLRAASLTDPDVMRTHEHHERLRDESFRKVVAMLEDRGALRPDLDPERATDIAFTVFGDGVWCMLRHQRGWSYDRVVAFMLDALTRLLLASAPNG